MTIIRNKDRLYEYISKHRRWLNGIILFLGIFVMFIETPHWSGPVGGEEAIAVIAWLLVAAGIVVRLWAAFYLGGHKNKQLISEGPYLLVRNPLYVGNIISVTGLAMLSESVVAGLIIISGTLLLYNATIRYEERKLAGKFADEYRDYRKRVPRLLPRLSIILQLLESKDVHQVTYINIRRELVTGLWVLGGALAIHLAAEMIEYLQAAKLFSAL